MMLWVWFDLSPAYLTGTFGVTSYGVICSRIDWKSFSDLSAYQTYTHETTHSKPHVYISPSSSIHACIHQSHSVLDHAVLVPNPKPVPSPILTKWLLYKLLAADKGQFCSVRQSHLHQMGSCYCHTTTITSCCGLLQVLASHY